MKPLEQIKYVRVDADNIVTGVWTTDRAAFDNLGSDDAVLVPNDERVGPGDKLNMRSRQVSKRELRRSIPPEPKPTFQEKRAAAYPSLNEFAEALTEKEMGDDTKWLRYLKTVKRVRASIPKP